MILVVSNLSEINLMSSLHHMLIISSSSHVRLFEAHIFMWNPLIIPWKLYDIFFNSNDRFDVTHQPLSVFLGVPYLIKKAIHICLRSLLVILGSL